MAGKDRRKRPMVVSRHGRYRFQTGMVTATLLQRGLDMADAFAIGTELRDKLRGREEITTDELDAEIDALVAARLGDSAVRRGPVTAELVTAGPRIRTTQGLFPFSRGVLLRFLVTAGLDPEEAMTLASRIGRWVSQHGGPEIAEAELEAEVERHLAEEYGEAAARRYRLTGLVRRSPKPVLILIGGATGTGKSTLGTELAFRLGIRLVTSTDMVRETMRTVLPADVVPGLHDHSFRGMFQGGQVLSDPRERVLAGFRQQAAQVAAGIRAVIRRAIREGAHMIVEGTHLVPPFEQYVPPGADVMVTGLIMAVPEEARHRARFPDRAQAQHMRRADDYLEAFQSVRWIHDDLLGAAEKEGSVVVATETLDQTVTAVVEYLSQSLPLTELGAAHPSALAEDDPEEPAVPTLFVILDGLSDEPNPALGGKTPLEAADTPTLRALAGAGGQGLIATGGPAEEAPETDEGLLALLGFGKQLGPKMGRGLLEALGQGLPLPPGSIVFRGNFASVQSDGLLTDRRAGRIRAGQADLLAELRDVALPGGVRGAIHPGHEHRVVVVLTGGGLSDQVSDTDPGGEAPVQQVLAPRPLDDSPEAARTATALAALLDEAHRHLRTHPLNARRRVAGQFVANCVITRGAAAADARPRPRAGADRTALVSGCTTALGVARAVGLQPATTPAMTGNLDTDLDAKFAAAAELFTDRSFVAVHIKGTDIAAHDRRPLEKRDFIGAVDAALGRFLADRPGLRVVVSADHGTSSITGNHIAVPVPLLLGTWQGPGEEADFDERSAARGALGVLQPGELAELLWER